FASFPELSLVAGSSAGAGSGEFHVYRHLRRREYQRQDFMDAMAEKQRLDEEFQKKLERNKMIAEEQTAKRRRKIGFRKSRESCLCSFPGSDSEQPLPCCFACCG
uniref:Uncharacterized protein n=1 Tax=Geospiza parvula TaxID=87175 RepID=A0A8C3MJB0_GEOPR